MTATWKAEAKVGDYVVVQYSPAFPLTVKFEGWAGRYPIVAVMTGRSA